MQLQCVERGPGGRTIHNFSRICPFLPLSQLASQSDIISGMLAFMGGTVETDEIRELEDAFARCHIKINGEISDQSRLHMLAREWPTTTKVQGLGFDARACVAHEHSGSGSSVWCRLSMTRPVSQTRCDGIGDLARI